MRSPPVSVQEIVLIVTIRLLVFLALATTLGGFASSASAQSKSEPAAYEAPLGSIVLRIEVLEVEFTDFYPGCGDDHNCVPFDFWYRYRARVREVISGEWKNREVQFTNLQHSEYIKRITRDCYVVLEPAPRELQSAVGVPFVADNLLFPKLKPDQSAIRALREKSDAAIKGVR